MDPFIATLAANAVAVLIPYVKKGAEEVASEVGKAAAEKIKILLNTLEARFSEDKEATDNLERFEEKPERYKSALEDILLEKLDQDKNLVAELKKLLKEIKDASLNIDVYIKMTEGEDVTGIRGKGMKKGNAKVSMEIEKGKKVTGVDVEQIG
ncbi:MAG: hypothetical protein GQ533_03725 [Methanosarcinaceae archaeon]|nr:hypothetical protein [Methanosarcinaceae archaeon]